MLNTLKLRLEDLTCRLKGRFPLQSFCPRGRSEQVSTFAIGVQSERFLSAFVRADTLGS